MSLIRIQKSGKAVMIMAPEGAFSYFHPDSLFTGFGWDAETASLLLLKRPVKSVLILGFGGGTVARQCRALFPRAEIVGVEISAQVLKMAYQHFGLSSLKVTTVNMSGEAFLRTTRRRFDAVIDDMWPPEPGSPKPLLVEPNWVSLINSRLKAGGMYAANLYNREESSFEVATAVRRLKTDFNCVREVSPGHRVTTIIAAGDDLHTSKEARAKLRQLAPALAHGLKHVSFRTLHDTA